MAKLAKILKYASQDASSENADVTRNALCYFPLFLAFAAAFMAFAEFNRGEFQHAILNAIIAGLLIFVVKLARNNLLNFAGNLFALSMVFCAAATTLSLQSAPYGLFVVAPALALLLVMTTSVTTGAVALIAFGGTLSIGVVFGSSAGDIDPQAIALLRGMWIALGCTFIAATVYKRGWQKIVERIRKVNGRLTAKDRTLQKIQSTSKTISFSYKLPQDSLILLDDAGRNLEIAKVHALSEEDWNAIALDQSIKAHLRDNIRQLQSRKKLFVTSSIQLGERWYKFVAETLCEEGQSDAPELIGIYNDITEVKGLENKLEYHAKYDDITGLMNRWFFIEKGKELLENAVEQEKLFYLFLDLDGFKRVNDTSGHAAGDKIIEIVGKLLADSLPEDSLCSRVGGDEFCGMFRASDDNAAYHLADSLRENISNAAYFWGVGNEIGASIGVVEVLLGHTTMEEAYTLSDMACMQAKRSGKNRVVMTHCELDGHQSLRTRNKMISLIQKGLAGENFSLVRQEVVPLKEKMSHRKYEVLIRMRDEKGDLVPTAEFLSVAEGFGYIKRIDRWVVNQTIKYIENSGTFDEYWVNLSGLSVSDESFNTYLVELVKQADIRPGQLNFEITETVAVEGSDVAATLIRRLQQYGVKIALDDFGVGHASFANLRSLPVDVVKIDGSYVRNVLDCEVDRVFASTIIQNSHALGKQIVAEYVENQAIADALGEMGADFVQGYHFGRPEPFIDGSAPGGLQGDQPRVENE